jgi:hypothetical protein
MHVQIYRLHHGTADCYQVNSHGVIVQLNHTQFLAHFFECCHGFFEVFPGMGS